MLTTGTIPPNLATVASRRLPYAVRDIPSLRTSNQHTHLPSMSLLLHQDDLFDGQYAVLAMSEACANYAKTAYLPSEFAAAVKASFQNYKTHGARSPKKLLPLHHYVASVLAGIWGEPFRVCYMGGNAKELTVEGKYYPKDIDISVISPDGKPVFCLGIKFVTSNYKQNANNYFEGMMGETANIQALRNLPYVQLIVLRYETHYFKKNESVSASRIEIINDADIQRYVRLLLDAEQAHRPRFMGIQFVDINEETCETKLTDLSQCSALVGTRQLLLSQLSLPRFFSNIKEYSDVYKTSMQENKKGEWP